jgi:hypothetical protein
MPKAQEDLEEYIHQYKSQTLTDINAETGKHFDLANQVDLKLGIQLLTLASAIFAVIGSFVVSQNHIENDGVRVLITLAITLLVISVGAGLRNLEVISIFWVEVGKYKHDEGHIIVNDKSKSYEDLVDLRSRLEEYRGNIPKRNDVTARAIQKVSFGSGVILLFTILLIKIFS